MKTFNEHFNESLKEVVNHINWAEWASYVVAFGQPIIMIAITIAVSIVWVWWFFPIGIGIAILYMILVGIPITVAVHDYVDERIKAFKEAAIKKAAVENE